MDHEPLYDGTIHAVNYYMNLNRDYTRQMKPRTRTLFPVKYYFIDFGSARQFNPKDGPPRIPVGHGEDRSVPNTKHRRTDPFAVDVYRVGNIIREGFINIRLLFVCIGFA
jgi:hypothetical protein